MNKTQENNTPKNLESAEYREANECCFRCKHVFSTSGYMFCTKFGDEKVGSFFVCNCFEGA